MKTMRAHTHPHTHTHTHRFGAYQVPDGHHGEDRIEGDMPDEGDHEVAELDGEPGERDGAAPGLDLVRNVAEPPRQGDGHEVAVWVGWGRLHD